ncbi:C-C motif chemokine 19 [Hemicordylus capensis]|uniref:C-C motif chemokine 19 n=1 Tax=Hemicordylus capensis TaxID=884348 RepID=UPI00230362F0|nr:C-C motif chemokine 19 [Hemicordylus capensis]
MARHRWLLGLMVALSLGSILQVAGNYQVMDCCLRTSPVRIPPQLVHDYREQQIQEGCLVQAVIFITVRGRQLCAPPDAGWVRQLKRRLDHHRRHHRQAQQPALPYSMVTGHTFLPGRFFGHPVCPQAILGFLLDCGWPARLLVEKQQLILTV